MKKIIIYLSLSLIAGTASFAQTAPAQKYTSKLKAEAIIQQLQGQLSLSDKQKTELYNVFFVQYTKIDSLKQINADKSVIKAQLKYDDAQITSLLTAPQLAKYNNWLAEKRTHTKR